MTNRWMILTMVVGLCWLAACSDGGKTSEQAETPAPAERTPEVAVTPPAEPVVETVVEPEPEPELVADVPAEPEAAGWQSLRPDRPDRPDAPVVEAPEPVVEEIVAPVIETPEPVLPSMADAPPMKPMLKPVIIVAAAAAAADAADAADADAADEDEVPAVLNFTMTTIDGDDKDLSDYQGKVLLIVNTASRCGYTGQYAGLQTLHDDYADEGLAVLGFPANNFGGQEPGTDAEIATFCTTNYSVTFDMFSKISVAGGDRHAFYDALTASDSSAIGWNFEKFLIGRDGTVIAHYRSDTDPSDAGLVAAIKAELAKDE